jgi:hypothetical protein
LAAAAFSPSKPNAHFSFRFADCADENPGYRWKRSLAGVTPHARQSAAVVRSGPAASHRGAAAGAAAAPAAGVARDVER